MRRAVLAMAFLAACATAPGGPSEPPSAPLTVTASDGAGNRLEALVADGDRFCTASRSWCLDGEGITYMADGTVRTPEVFDDFERAVWPFVVFVGGREDHVLLGVTSAGREMYSGGGAATVSLTLYEVVGWDPTAIAPLLSVQTGAAIMIRACFTEDDMRARRGACHDEYAYSATLNLDPSVTEGHPRFIYVSEAASYPGRISRDDDNTNMPLRAADLVWARDETCSYRRVFTLVLEAEGYVPDAEQPACTTYQLQ